MAVEPREVRTRLVALLKITVPRDIPRSLNVIIGRATAGDADEPYHQ